MFLTTPQYQKTQKITIQWIRRVTFGVKKDKNLRQKVEAISQKDWKIKAYFLNPFKIGIAHS